MPAGSVTSWLSLYIAPLGRPVGLRCTNDPIEIARPEMNVGSGEINTASDQNFVPFQTSAPLFFTVQVIVAFSPEKFCCGAVTEITCKSAGFVVTAVAALRSLLFSKGPSK